MSSLERFVIDPGAVRRTAVGWGERSSLVDLPGGPYRIDGLCDSQVATAVEHYRSRCRPAAEGQPTVCVEVRRVGEEAFSAFDLRGWVWDVAVERSGERLEIASLHFLAVVQMGKGTWDATLWTCERTGDGFHGVLENFLRVLMAHRLLLAEEGLLLHSAGVVAGGSAHCFLGRSGAGKSTLSRLALESGRVVLSDDLNAVLWSGGEPVLERFPFAGDLRDRLSDERGRFPLRGLWRLAKAQEHRVEAISEAQMASTVIVCAPFVNSCEQNAEALLQRAHRLVASTAHGTLCFRPDLGFWPLVDEAASARGVPA